MNATSPPQPQITIRLATHADIDTCWSLWRQSSYNYPIHRWLHQHAARYPQEYEAAFKATMTFSLQRNFSPWGRIAVVAVVQNTILAFGIWRRMSRVGTEEPTDALNIRMVNEVINREFGVTPNVPVHLAWYHHHLKSWNHHDEDKSIIGPPRPGERESLARQTLYRRARLLSPLEPEGLRRSTGLMTAAASRWVLDYTGYLPVSGYARSALLEVVRWGARVAREEALDAFVEVDPSRDRDVMVRAGFELFCERALLVPGESVARRFCVMKLRW